MRSLEQNGWSYFTSRFADETNARTFASEFPVEIVFNYTGLCQQLERSDALLKKFVCLMDVIRPLASRSGDLPYSMSAYEWTEAVLSHR